MSHALRIVRRGMALWQEDCLRAAAKQHNCGEVHWREGQRIDGIPRTGWGMRLPGQYLESIFGVEQRRHDASKRYQPMVDEQGQLVLDPVTWSPYEDAAAMNRFMAAYDAAVKEKDYQLAEQIREQARGLQYPTMTIQDGSEGAIVIECEVSEEQLQALMQGGAS